MNHAYLVVAHRDPVLLQALLDTLDDAANDIYLHVDRKSAMDPAALRLPKSARTVLMPRMEVTWGGDTQIECTLRMLEKATADGPHAYYHLISGGDLPIKSQEEIHERLHAGSTVNYLNVDHAYRYPEDFGYRIGEYHVFQNRIGRRTDPAGRLLRLGEKVSLKAQRLVGVNRVKRFGYPLYKGSNWFSITDALARYVVQQAPMIRKKYYRSFLSDEVFLQSIALNSPFRDTVADDDLRLVDWTRGTPYVWRSEDLDTIRQSDKLFARKFDTDVDARIVEEVCAMVR